MRCVVIVCCVLFEVFDSLFNASSFIIDETFYVTNEHIITAEPV